MTAETPLVRGHRLTPSFTDSAIDVELTEEFAHDHEEEDQDEDDKAPAIAPSKGDADLLDERIVHIAQLVANNDALRRLSQDERSAVNTYLDNIEKILDPRRDISRNIALNRPALSTSNATPTPTSPLSIADSQRKPMSKATTLSQSQSQTQNVSHDLTSILKELSSVNSELQQRYLESRHIHDVFIVKCEGLAQRIIELEEEVHELYIPPYSQL